MAFIDLEEPFSVPNRGPVPRIEKEEGKKFGQIVLTPLDKFVLPDPRWTSGLKWHERLYSHFTMSSVRRNCKFKRPYEPRDELDFVMEAVFCPQKELFPEKTDPYLHIETVTGERPGYKRRKHLTPSYKFAKLKKPLKRLDPEQEDKVSWRVLKNRVVIYPDKNIPRSHPLLCSNGGVSRRENIYNVKLGIPADHSSHSNPGYSRTPSGAFYCI